MKLVTLIQVELVDYIESKAHSEKHHGDFGDVLVAQVAKYLLVLDTNLELLSIVLVLQLDLS